MSDPHSKPTVNHEAERAVLAALIRNPDGKDIIRLGIHADLFTNLSVKEAFSGVCRLIADNVQPDPATLRNALSQAARIEYETSMSVHVSAANLAVWVTLLKDCERERRCVASRDWLTKAIDARRPADEIRKLFDDLEALQQPTVRRSTFSPLADLLKAPPAENWLVDGFIGEDSTNVIFGDSGSGKTFVTIDLLCHVAAGLPWRGHDTLSGPVMYLAGEGQNGIIRRFKAWFEAHPGHEDAIHNVLIRTVPAAIGDPVAVAAIADEIRGMPVKPRAIAIDTLARNFGAGDENSTRDMNQFVSGLDALRVASGAAILVPHHSGHGEKSRGRGSSVLRAAIDAEFLVERSEQRITVRCMKMKDADEPAPLSWLLTRQDLPWCDAKGRPLNSAVLVPTEAGQSGTFEEKSRLPAAQRIAVDALRTALIRDGIDADGVVTVAEDQWRQACYSAGISSSDKPDSCKKAFNRARQDLVANG
ncbi:MAG TPA: hypothetical protein DIC59_03415, partial [Candidatus Competibacteraceae bacterium]|nr:hypothetical protein [Candidatus Competibacteraceae bacterium]